MQKDYCTSHWVMRQIRVRYPTSHLCVILTQDDFVNPVKNKVDNSEKNEHWISYLKVRSRSATMTANMIDENVRSHCSMEVFTWSDSK